MTPAEQGRVVVWRQRDGFWRWQYVLDGTGGTDTERFTSHTEFLDHDEARSSAEVAFPGAPVEDVGQPPGRGRRVLARTLLVGAIVVLTGMIVRRIRRTRPGS